MIFGEFRASDHGLIPISFSYGGMSEDGIGMMVTTSEEFIGHSPIPIYLGDKFSEKLKFKVTFGKNPCTFHDDVYFTERDCRWLLRSLTGQRGYQWTKLLMDNEDENLWYRAKVNNVVQAHVGGRVVGMAFEFECDSCFAWSVEKNVTIQASPERTFCIYNDSDDLFGYVLPNVAVSPSSTGTITISNKTDGFVTELRNVQAGEKVIMDSKLETISSSHDHEHLLDDFNLNWIRLLPGKNEYVCSGGMDVTITMKYRTPRKVGIVG